jgi:hypothetical protein
MSSGKRFSVDLRKLDYRPEMSPFLQSVEVPVKKSRVRSGLSERPLIDGESGELVAASVIHQIQEMDTDQFVKVFAQGIALAYELSRTGQRVFQAILREYEKTPMHGGYADEVYLVWFDGGLDGRALDMSEYTFNRGLRELLDKAFISPRSPGRFWVNPSLFFKGDRVMFVKEYKRALRVTNEPSVISITGTSHVVAPDDGASRPRQSKLVSQDKSREPTKPLHAPSKPVLPASGFRFGKKKKAKGK